MPSSPEDARLAALSKELDAAVSRINALQGGGGTGATGSADSPSNQAVASTSSSSPSQKKPPFRARASSHLSRHGNRLTSALLAGCAFAIAAGRLSDSRERREAEAAWADERRELEARAEAAEAALRDAMLRLRSERGGGSEGGGGGGSRWSGWLPSVAARTREGVVGVGGESPLSSSPSSPPQPPPPPPKPRMI